MTWNPQAAVTVAGNSYTGKTFAGANITYGRQNTYEQPRAGYCAVSVYDFGAGDSIAIGDPITVTAKDASNVTVKLFTGTVSDVVTTVIAASPNGTYLRKDIIGTALLGKLNRTLAGGSGYSAQNDGDRVAAILQEVYATTWAKVPATQTWASTSSTLTWATYDSSTIGTIDTPGYYALSAYSSGATNAYNLTTNAANSGLGVLYDTPDGPINYDDADHRQTNAMVNGYWTIPTAAITSAGLTQSVRLGDIANVVQLTYTGGTVTVTDAASVATYGQSAKAYSTELSNFTDATEQASRYLGLTSSPTPQFDTLALAVHQPNLTTADVNKCLRVYNGQPIQATGLPNALGGTFTGFIEGWTWRIAQTTADLKLTVSDYARSTVSLRWVGVPPSIKWNTVEPTLEWSDL